MQTSPNAPERPAARGARLAAAGGLLLAALSCPAQDADTVEFRASLAQALAAAREANAVTAVLFSVPGCSWCRKLSLTTLADPRVVALSKRFVWVKLNAHAHPDTAALFGVTALPHLVLLNVEGRPVAARTGYLPPAEMLGFLQEHQDKAGAGGDEASIRELADRVRKAADGALGQAVERLAKPDLRGRGPLLEAIRACGPPAWDGLCQLLGDERLAVRAAARDALARATGADVTFDPFADPQQRARQVEAWKKWVRENRHRPTTRPASRPAGAADSRGTT